MKKLVMLLLVGAMMVSLVACGDKTSPSSTAGEAGNVVESSDESSEESSDESSEESKKD